MKKSRFIDTQIVGILKEAEGGITMAGMVLALPPFISADPNTAALKRLSFKRV